MPLAWPCSIDTFHSGAEETSVGHINFLPKPALLTLRATSYSDFPFFCTVILLLCQHGSSALVRDLPSDPPHGTSRLPHYLSATAYRLFGRRRDLHPQAYDAATRTKNYRDTRPLSFSSDENHAVSVIAVRTGGKNVSSPERYSTENGHTYPLL